MALSKNMALGLSSLAVVTALAVGGGSIAMAQGNGENGSLVDRVATKFNLNKADVQAVFDEDRDARQAERSAEVSSDLQKSVDAGKITAEQKTLIEQKQAELEKARDAKRDAMEQWAIDNNIDESLLHMGMEKGGHGGGPRQ